MRLGTWKKHKCKVCGGNLYKLGKLGKLVHSRCRNCGMEFSLSMKEIEKRNKF